MSLLDGKIYMVYGRRGSGKSYMVKKMMRGYPRIIAFDPVAEYGKLRGWKTAHSLEELHKLIIANWKKGFKISFPVAIHHQQALHDLSVYVWELQEGARQKIMIVAEELDKGFPSKQMKDSLYGFGQLIMQGRHRGVEIIGVTQRPKKVNADIRSNLEAAYFFRVRDEVDIKFIRDIVGRELIEKYQSMKPYYHMKVTDNEVTFEKA